MNARATEAKVQKKNDGSCHIQIPAFVRDEMELTAGTLLRWTPLGLKRWQIEVSGFEEPKAPIQADAAD